MRSLQYLAVVLILGLLMTFAAGSNAASTGKAYYALSEPRRIIPRGPAGAFDSHLTHTLSIVELNRDGYRYWGYYTGLGADSTEWSLGHAFSNDLVHWTKDAGNPIVPGLRWGTAVAAGGVVHLFGTRNYSADSSIVHLTSTDGVSFTEQATVAAAVPGERHQNPFVFYDARHHLYRLYFFHYRDGEYRIEEKHAPDPAGLAAAAANLILSDREVLAAPSVLYRDGRYWLTAEIRSGPGEDAVWQTIAFVSDEPLSGFVPVREPIILGDGDACYFQYVFEDRLYGVYSHEAPDHTWEMYLRTHNFAPPGGR